MTCKVISESLWELAVSSLFRERALATSSSTGQSLCNLSVQACMAFMALLPPSLIIHHSLPPVLLLSVTLGMQFTNHAGACISL